MPFRFGDVVLVPLPFTDQTALKKRPAVVVSRGASARQIADQLSASVDAAFVPRPLVLVDHIPRDPVGKISRAQLLELARGTSAGE